MCSPPLCRCLQKPDRPDRRECQGSSYRSIETRVSNLSLELKEKNSVLNVVKLGTYRMEKLYVIIALPIVTEFLARVLLERCCLASPSASARNASGCSFLYTALERSSLMTFRPGAYCPFLMILVNTRVQGHIKFAHETWDRYLINTFSCACI